MLSMKSFIVTTIVDLVVFLMAYYSIFMHEVINIKILFMAVSLFLFNRFIIKIIKDQLKTDTKDALAACPLPLNEEHALSELILPTFDLKRPTIFLSINGVLHRNANGTIEHKLLFMDLFQDNPDLQIVISSTLRTDCTEFWLKEKLGNDLFSKVVGYTPVSTSQNKSDEIELFLKSYPLTNFVVVDPGSIEISGVLGIETESYIGLTPELIADISIAVGNKQYSL